jgi:hypothetical protein
MVHILHFVRECCGLTTGLDLIFTPFFPIPLESFFSFPVSGFSTMAFLSASVFATTFASFAIALSIFFTLFFTVVFLSKSLFSTSETTVAADPTKTGADGVSLPATGFSLFTAFFSAFVDQKDRPAINPIEGSLCGGHGWGGLF